jgi:putative transposase
MLELTKQMYVNYERFPSMNALNELAKTSGLYSQTSQDIFRRLKKSISYMVAKRKKGLTVGFPRFKGIDRVKSITYPQSGFLLDASRKKLKVTPFGEINIKLHRPIGGKIRTLTLKKEATWKWYAIFTAETEIHPVPIKEGEHVGIDLGLMTFATLSNSEKIQKPNHFKKYEEKLADVQRKLSRKKRGGRNRKKVKARVARVHEKIANVRKDWLHKTANYLLAKYSLIALEDLKVQEIAEEHGAGISDAGWSIFTNILSYKAEEAGCEVVFVNPKNTSKDCSRCGIYVPKELWERQHNCPSCSLSIDRDHNAAINILNRATNRTTNRSIDSSFGATLGMRESNACGDVSIETSMKQEAAQFIGR